MSERDDRPTGDPAPHGRERMRRRHAARNCAKPNWRLVPGRVR